MSHRPTVVMTGISRHDPSGLRWAPHEKAEGIMIGHVGDRLVVEGTHLGDRRRVGIITAVSHTDGAPPYTVRWLDDGRTTLIFPGPEARIEPPAASSAPA